MLKIRALNRESSSDEDVPVIRREAQEEIVLELYNNALRLQADGKYSESESILLKLIDENIPLLENNGGLPKSMSTLKYSCYVNLGNIYLKENKVNKALEKYLTASELDSTDVTLWYKIGKLALKVDKFKQSAYAYSKGLDCSESHWPCLDQLISVLFAIKDTVACLVYIGKALMLDADYLKGLVLRKQIYRDNPATKEYYQLYNPDYIWEPPLDVSIEEEDEKNVLEEVQALCNHVIEVEKSYGPKPLQTIPLPKPLEDYCWTSLAKTITYLHQYITDNEMSHFTMIDINKCMSQTADVRPKSPEEAVNIENKVDEEEKRDKLSEEKGVEHIPEVIVENEEKMDVESIPERRFSQNSETNNDGQESTPTQTDNDEEQNMDQDHEEPDENSELKAERGRPRGTKRKRNLLSDLQIWGWHSKRKQSKKAKDKDFTVEDALNRIIPKNLLPNKIDAEKITHLEDSMNTMDLYNMYIGDHNVNYLSPIHSPKSVNYEPYFGTYRERDDVLEFWTKQRDYCDAVVLIKDLVFNLSKLWHYKWPKELVPLYIDAYNMFREHCDQPQVFCGDSTFQDIQNDALATLLHGELLSFSSETKETIHPTSLGYLQVVSGWDEKWQEEYAFFFSRVFWLRSFIFRKENCNDLAIRSLQLIQEVIAAEELKSNEKYLLTLPNCFRYGLITNEITEKILQHLDMIISLGTVESLYNSERYDEVAEILKLTFNKSGNHPQVGRMGRPAQLGLLLHSLWFTDFHECFIWTEECLYEALDSHLKSRKDADKWGKIIEKCLAMLYEIIKKETVSIIDSLNEEKRTRLVESLCRIASKQLNTDNAFSIPLECVTPWILLHYVLLREEHRQYASKRITQGRRDKIDTANHIQDMQEDELPPSIAILFSGHEFLGPKGWCLTSHGELLHFILDTLLDRLDTPIFERFRDKIDIHIEQALFCLYQHPSKKNKISRHLADHNVDPLPLTWERSFQLYEFYGPDCLPEFNSYKNASISGDLEQLLKRIIALVPQDSAPQHHLGKIVDFIHGKSDQCPEPIEFANKVKAIYYLIGDFYFKQREFAKSVKYFQMDLCINPLRLDSWACLGLSYAAQLDLKLNFCEKFKSETEFLDKAKYATICFKKALDISPDPLMLWIECGTFQYTVHSYCSRILKYESENLSMDKFDFLETQKNCYLDSSGNSFEKAIALYEMDETNEPDERWLQYYILGKIAEKKQKEPAEYLQYYMTASTLLDENSATYPEKILYTNPQHLAVEALELHYRIHASVLKYLELHEGKDIPSSLGTFFKKCMNSSKFLRKPAPKTDPDVPSKPTENSTLSFQEQFLNSLNKPNEDESKKTVEESIEIPKKVDMVDIISSGQTPNIEEAVTDKEVLEPAKAVEKEKVDNSDVIMISDSDDEKSDIIKTEGKREESKAEQAESKAEQAESKAVQAESMAVQAEPRAQVKDVQQMLDEMMVQTMKETEQQPNEVDSDLSGTEKIEEVTCKEDIEEVKVQQKIDDKPENVDNNEPKKVKPSDSETDTDNIRTSVEDDSTSSSSSLSSSSSSTDSESDDDDDDSSSTTSSSSTETNNENMSNSEILQLVDRCIAGLEICITRLTQNYKALYRLAHLYFHYKAKKDWTKCKQLLLGQYKCKDGTLVTGLFNDRRTNNFFNGIWRIPSNEIDRPGSLSAHMSRCISLLMQILRNTNDNKTLIDLCLQLRKAPDQNKIYIKDSDRMAFSEQAMTMCIQSLRGQIKSVSNMPNSQIVKLLQEIFRVHQKIQKHIPAKESVFTSMLIEVYKSFIKEKIPDNVNVLDLAIKFCQQNRPIEKHKPQIVQHQVPVLPRGPGIANPPVLPTPSTLAPVPSVPLKRPGAGRPRGRPPLPKIPGQVRQPRGKNPNAAGISKSYQWQKSLFDQSYAYEYLKHYQDELIKQYSQNLSLPQLTQLSQILTQGQLNNPLTASAITNQFLAHSGLLNPSSLVKQISSATSAVNQSSTAQLMESLNQLNPSLKKKLGVDQALSSLSTDQLKFLGNIMLPTTKHPAASNKTNLPYTVTSSSVVSSKMRPQFSNPKPSASSTSKPIDAHRQSTITTSKTSINPIFKEPILTKTSSPDEKAAKVLMKDRPNISITPVSGGMTIPATSTASFTRSIITTNAATSNFIRPNITTSPSSGKTLQEKLADKKKEQFNKQQLKKSVDTDIYTSEALMKSLNLPSIPSSLTVSKASIPVSSSTFLNKPNATIPKTIPNVPKTIPNLPKTVSSPTSKYPVDLGRPLTHTSKPTVSQPKFTMEPGLPSSLTVSKTTMPLHTPKFPLESGISISQVPIILPKKAHEKSRTSTSKQSTAANIVKKISAGKSVDISPIMGKSDNLSSKKSNKHMYHNSPIKTSEMNFKKSTNFAQKQNRKYKFSTKEPLDVNLNSHVDRNLTASSSWKTPKPTSPSFTYKTKSVPTSVIVTKGESAIKDLRQEAKQKEITITKSVSQSNPPQQKDLSDDSIICID